MGTIRAVQGYTVYTCHVQITERVNNAKRVNDSKRAGLKVNRQSKTWVCLSTFVLAREQPADDVTSSSKK